MERKLNDLFYCKQCGLILEIIHPGAGTPVCCNENMTILHGNTAEANFEKHLPVTKQYGDLRCVMVGSKPHPMTDDHHIVWIEINFNNRTLRHYCSPGEKPETEFCGIPENAKVTTRAFCNLHGLWQSCDEYCK